MNESARIPVGQLFNMSPKAKHIDEMCRAFSGPNEREFGNI
jgi:hypothetical protein